MDSRFQSSFIPRKPVDSGSLRPSGDVNIILIVGILIFIITAAAAGGVFVYKSSLDKVVEEKNTTLINAKNSFGLEEISALKQRARQLEAVKSILTRHVSVAPLFSLIENNTLKSVRFNSFSFSYKDGSANVSLVGEARGWNAVAYQSQVFTRLSEFTSPVLSGFAPNEKGTISFNFASDVKSDILLYSRTLDVTSGFDSEGEDEEAEQ